MEFVRLDLDAPLDVAAHVGRSPAESKVKGLFFNSALKRAEARTGQKLSTRTYHALSDYPSAELSQVLVDCAGATFPEVPLRRALFTLGQQVFPELRQSTVGVFLFSVAINNIGAALKTIGRAYRVFSSHAEATLEVLTATEAVISLRKNWTFADCYHVGIIDGAIAGYSKKAEILLHRQSPCDVDVKLVFSEPIF